VLVVAGDHVHAQEARRQRAVPGWGRRRPRDRSEVANKLRGAGCRVLPRKTGAAPTPAAGCEQGDHGSSGSMLGGPATSIPTVVPSEVWINKPQQPSPTEEARQ